MKLNKLSGKVALVTGGSRGIGAAIAKALADDGADVAISYSASADKAKAVVNALLEKGVRAHAFKADQGNPAEVEALVKSLSSASAVSTFWSTTPAQRPEWHGHAPNTIGPASNACSTSMSAALPPRSARRSPPEEGRAHHQYRFGARRATPPSPA